MRYKETGCVHMDFHRTMNATISYIAEKYGEDFLKETFRRTAHCVYRSIWEDLKRGDAGQLIEHWKYYFDRENGGYKISEAPGTVTLEVSRCPAVSFLRKSNIRISPFFCSQTIELNRALSEQTPFEIETQLKGPGSCVQTIRRKNDSE